MRLLLAALALAAPLAAQPPQVLTPDAPVAGDNFGFAVALADTLAAVGAPGRDDAGDNAGALTLYRRDGGAWAEVARLSVADPGARLGRSVAFGEGIVVAGAPYADGRAGAVRIAWPDAGWAFVDRLEAPSPQPNAEFGTSVAAAGDHVLVGAPGASEATLFRYDGVAWTVEAAFPSATPGDEAGASVAIRGDLVAVGAPSRTVEGLPTAGAVDLYARDAATGAWALVTTLTAPTPAREAEFGQSVAIDGARVLVGAWLEPEGDLVFAGAAYLFEPDRFPGAWQALHRFVPSRREAHQYAGSAVAFEGDRVVVGAWGDDGGGAHAGLTVVFDCSPGGGWTEAAVLVPPDPVGSNSGQAVAVLGADVWVGGPAAGPIGGQHGAAYAYTVDLPTAAAPSPRVTSAVAIRPNPTSGPVELHLTPAAPTVVRVTLTDLLGRRVATSEHTVGRGPQALALDLGALPPGLYLWRAEGAAVDGAGRVTVVR